MASLVRRGGVRDRQGKGHSLRRLCQAGAGRGPGTDLQAQMGLRKYHKYKYIFIDSTKMHLQEWGGGVYLHIFFLFWKLHVDLRDFVEQNISNPYTACFLKSVRSANCVQRDR